MKIAYVTTYDSSDFRAWSGTGSFILKTLENCGFQIAAIKNLHIPIYLNVLIKKVIYTKILKKRYLRNREPIILKSLANQVMNNLAHINYDILFSPGTIPISYLQITKPIIFWTDSTFSGMVNFYPSFSNLCAETLKNGHKMEQLALSKCRLAIYASDWAANTARQYYDVNPEKVKVVPFGANIICNRNNQDIDTIIRNKDIKICKLLFVGVDWFRKGGDIAVKIAGSLIKRGYRTELHVVGCKPVANMPEFVRQHGFLSKDTQTGQDAFDKLMTETHFLILPSRAECYGVVFAEASSYGLPSLATRVGGIPTVIRDGKNGQTFPLDSSPEKYCDYIEKYLLAPKEYQELALSSFNEYTERLNWSSAGKQIYDLVHEFC